MRIRVGGRVVFQLADQLQRHVASHREFGDVEPGACGVGHQLARGARRSPVCSAE
jgi:hypothetical protein